MEHSGQYGELWLKKKITREPGIEKYITHNSWKKYAAHLMSPH